MKNKYYPKIIEDYIKNIWNLYNKNNINKNKNNNNYYSILLPPPNMTGNIHIGHILQYFIVDFYIRFNKMLGKKTLSILGIDHAGISTQILIEKKILNENKDINLLIKNTLNFKKNIKFKLINDLNNIGVLIDNKNKIRFTLDKHYQYSVNKIFSTLYYDGLIYKNNKIINWDIKLKTVIPDLEIINKKKIDYIWYIKYYFVNSEIKDKFIVISTTKPETIFADSAIAINKNDIRYNKYIGEKVLVPIINRIITIIHSDEVIINHESGCIKVSPSNSFNDYKIALKNNLKIIKIFDNNFIIKDFFEIYDLNNNLIYTEECPNIFKKLDIISLKKNILNFLINNNYIFNKKYKIINVKYNSRNMSKIEPYITNQWYIKTNNISKIAINLVKNKRILFFPKKYEKIYFNWLNKIEDWCISRQIWWGHKIPIWYNKNIIYSGINEKDIRKKFNIPKNTKLIQEKSVLDTWFSSSIWSFVSLGWPNNINKLIKYYPHNLVISGFDIIFFWISRMIMISSYIFRKNSYLNLPFKNIYITGLITDKNGNKISKTKNNIINYLDILNTNIKNKEYLGIDSLRISLLSLNSTCKYINFNEKLILTYNKFCNKIWNVLYFIISKIDFNIIKYSFYLKKIVLSKKKIYINNINLYNNWIIDKLNTILSIYNNLTKNYRLDILIKYIYNFIYIDISRYYIEFIKNKIKIKNKIINNYILFYLLDTIIKILHPIVPFITEKINIDILLKLKINNINNNLLINNKFPNIIFDIKKDCNNIINILLYIIKEIGKLNRNIIVYIKKKKIFYNIIKININKIICNKIDIKFLLLEKIEKDFIINY
ncbi:valine--tRNA ligase [Candidatus Nardonella dryophthoridicola]|uniref:Valine--tRNA ligase n=1 Tax=endosymbiont of Rhynchophorus ferrugineus TaxID=1972133 RepID=A0A2Z5TPN5_9GAMM|nr:valine--tRNA ligase [Candidatus Nardonella dryophthoridicola]BBA85024.1 valine--tRNA ligase [endosymbiont of Rhynchophorus ferrugineus]